MKLRVKLINRISCSLYVLLSAKAFGQTCNLSTVSLNFGAYDAFAASPNLITGKITETCDAGLPFVITLTPGENSGGSFHPRKMVSSKGDTLIYNLYRDPTFNEVLGDGTGNTFTLTGIGGNNSFTVYGSIPPLQNVAPGIYSDSAVVTIEW